jgi:hypothetical protein
LPAEESSCESRMSFADSAAVASLCVAALLSLSLSLLLLRSMVPIWGAVDDEEMMPLISFCHVNWSRGIVRRADHSPQPREKKSRTAVRTFNCL